MNKVRPLFQIEIGASEKCADISKLNLGEKILGKVIKFQVNISSLSNMREDDSFPPPTGPDWVKAFVFFSVFSMIGQIKMSVSKRQRQFQFSKAC